MIELRPYQQEVIDEFERQVAAGNHRAMELSVAGCHGGGKRREGFRLTFRVTHATGVGGALDF